MQSFELEKSKSCLVSCMSPDLRIVLWPQLAALEGLWGALTWEGSMPIQLAVYNGVQPGFWSLAPRQLRFQVTPKHGPYNFCTCRGKIGQPLKSISELGLLSSSETSDCCLNGDVSGGCTFPLSLFLEFPNDSKDSHMRAHPQGAIIVVRWLEAALAHYPTKDTCVVSRCNFTFLKLLLYAPGFTSENSLKGMVKHYFSSWSILLMLQITRNACDL